jgi:hypothetical protein
MAAASPLSPELRVIGIGWDACMAAASLLSRELRVIGIGWDACMAAASPLSPELRVIGIGGMRAWLLLPLSRLNCVRVVRVAASCETESCVV